MALRVRVRFFGNDQQRACDDPEIAKVIARDMCSPWLIWGTEKANRHVQAFANGAGCEMRLHFDLSWAQARQHDFFVLTAKHVIRESHTVAVANTDCADTLPVHHVTEFGAFKVRDKLFVHKIKPYDDRIWSMEFCEGFIARNELADETLKRFSGTHEAQVLHHKTQDAIPGWKAWYSAQWLPRLIQDETTHVMEVFTWKYIDTYGLHAGDAEDLKKMPDVFRIPQVYNKFGDSSYVVSKPVMEYWYGRGIKKSFFFQPLLVTGSDAYAEYLDLWHEMKSALSVNPRNKIA